MLLSLKGETISYSGSDLEGIASTLAEKWIRGKQQRPEPASSERGPDGTAGKSCCHERLHGKTNWAELFAYMNRWEEDEEGSHSGPAKYPLIRGIEK